MDLGLGPWGHDISKSFSKSVASCFCVAPLSGTVPGIAIEAKVGAVQLASVC